MSRLAGTRSHRRSEAQAFFAEAYPFPVVGVAVGLIAIVDVASAVATLLALY
jgi:hypothetical protein